MKNQFHTYVNFIKSKIAECRLGNDYVKLMNKRPVRQIPDKKYYNFDCKLPSDSLTSSVAIHFKNLNWVNPYADNNEEKSGWAPGNVFSVCQSKHKIVGKLFGLTNGLISRTFTKTMDENL